MSLLFKPVDYSVAVKSSSVEPISLLLFCVSLQCKVAANLLWLKLTSYWYTEIAQGNVSWTILKKNRIDYWVECPEIFFKTVQFTSIDVGKWILQVTQVVTMDVYACWFQRQHPCTLLKEAVLTWAIVGPLKLPSYAKGELWKVEPKYCAIKMVLSHSERLEFLQGRTCLIEWDWAELPDPRFGLR